MKRILACLCLLAGCHRLLGLDPLEQPPIDAIEPTLAVTGTGHLHYPENTSPSFAPKVFDELHLPPDLTLSVVLDDGTPSPVEFRPDGSFAFALASPGQSYRLFKTTKYGTVELQSSSQHLELSDRYGGRLDAVPPTSPTILQFRAGVMNGNAWVASTGIWAQTPTGMTATATFDYDWFRAGAPLPPLYGLLRMDRYDRLYLLSMINTVTTDSLLGYSTIDQSAAYSITQVDGMPNMLMTGVQPLSRSMCSRIVALRVEALARVKSADTSYSGYGVDWNLFATPSPILGGVAVNTVANAGDTSSTGSDFTGNVVYGNPYPGTTILGSLAAFAARTATAPGTVSPISIFHGGRVFFPVTPGTPGNCTSAVFLAIQGVPALPSLGAERLDIDGKTLSLASEDARVMTWTLAAAGPVDFYTVAIYEVANVGNKSELKLVQYIATTTASARIDGELLVPGKVYIAQIVSVIGYPNARHGDFETIAAPFGTMATWSHTFRVQ